LQSIPDSQEKINILESLEEITKNTEYINKIVQDLQDYARPLNPKTEQSNINQIARKIIEKSHLPCNIKATVRASMDARTIETDSYYINRILYNLITNAIQAMPNGGKLTVQACKKGRQTVISVKDTGIGIPDEVRSKMFTVMFTTKSKGQGFGLPVVKRMTEALGGTVTYESKVGKGTTFFIAIPGKRRTKHPNVA
jgi:signal transduction histidine kinase